MNEFYSFALDSSHFVAISRRIHLQGGLRQVRGVPRQAQVRREGHQEEGVRRQDLHHEAVKLNEN